MISSFRRGGMRENKVGSIQVGTVAVSGHVKRHHVTFLLWASTITDLDDTIITQD